MYYHLFAAYHRRTKHLIYLPYSHLLESRHWHPARAARYKAAWSTDTEQERGRSHRNSLSSSHHAYTVLFVFISILYRIPYQHQPSPPLRPLPLSRFRNASPPSPVRHPTNQKPVQPDRKKSPSKAIKSMPICGRQGRHSLRCRPSVPGANGFMKPAGLHDVVFKDRFAHCHDWKRRLVHSFVPLVSLGEATMKSRQ